MRKRLISAALVLALAAGPLAAQELQFDQPSDLVSSLVVKATTPGPAWWKVSDADTTVWILGSLQDAPRRAPWNSSALQRRIKAADLLILPDNQTFSLLGLIGFFLKFGDYVNADQPFETRLPPELYARLQAAEPQLRRPLQPKQRSMIAAMFVRGAAEDTVLRGRRGAPTPESRARDFARRNGVKVESTGEVEITAQIKAALTMPEADQQTCLSDALDAFDQRQTLAPALLKQAQAWASGDAPAAVVPPRITHCPSPPAYRQLESQERDDLVAKIAAAMDKPGRVVAVIDIPMLVATGGVLEQLKAKGFTITPPDGVGDDGLPSDASDNGGVEEGDLAN